MASMLSNSARNVELTLGLQKGMKKGLLLFNCVSFLKVNIGYRKCICLRNAFHAFETIFTSHVIGRDRQPNIRDIYISFVIFNYPRVPYFIFMTDYWNLCKRKRKSKNHTLIKYI